MKCESHGESSSTDLSGKSSYRNWPSTTVSLLAALEVKPLSEGWSMLPWLALGIASHRLRAARVGRAPHVAALIACVQGSSPVGSAAARDIAAHPVEGLARGVGQGTRVGTQRLAASSFSRAACAPPRRAPGHHVPATRWLDHRPRQGRGRRWQGHGRRWPAAAPAGPGCRLAPRPPCWRRGCSGSPRAPRAPAPGRPSDRARRAGAAGRTRGSEDSARIFKR
jgi:hypothetical protein